MDESKEFLKLIGNNVRKLRNDRGMSQQDLADYCNIAKSTIQRIENGSMNPTILMLQSISKILGVEVESLIRD